MKITNEIGKFLRDYFLTFSDDELFCYRDFFVQNLSEDTSLALNMIAKDMEKDDNKRVAATKIDKWLKSAVDIDEFYQMLDCIQEVVEKEYSKRFIYAAT